MTQTTSLFHYPPGKSYSDYNDLNFKPDFIDLSALEENPEATDICGDNKQCLYDFITTGDKSFAQETMNLVVEQQEAQNDIKPGTIST